MALQNIGGEIWIADGPTVSFYGFAYPTRMAVVRLKAGEPRDSSMLFTRSTLGCKSKPNCSSVTQGKWASLNHLGSQAPGV